MLVFYLKLMNEKIILCAICFGKVTLKQQSYNSLYYRSGRINKNIIEYVGALDKFSV